jgi:integrase/recombinase XerD
MGDLPRVRVVGALEPYAAGFGAELARSGYTFLSARGQLELVAHLSRWLARAWTRRR